MAKVRASEVLRRLEGVKNPVGAEIGVAIGQMSACLLARGDLTLYMVDSWLGTEHQLPDYVASGDGHGLYTQVEQNMHYHVAAEATEFAAERRHLLRMKSDEAAKSLEGGSLDFVFIDADHTARGCAADICAWTPKVRAGGWLAGHDYDYPHLPGVREAVDAAVAANGWKLETGANYTWFVRMP